MFLLNSSIFRLENSRIGQETLSNAKSDDVFCPLKEDTIQPGKMWKCHKVSTIRRCGFTFFLSKLEVDALEKGKDMYPWQVARQKKKQTIFWEGGTIGVDSIKVVAQLFRISLGNI